jgi:HK97 gp10 family phage protein
MAVGFSIDVRIKGAEEVQARLLKKGDRVHDAVRDVLQDLGNSIADRARQAAPFRHGKLRASIGVRLVDGKDRLAVYVQPKWFTGLFYERGVEPQDVKVKGYVRTQRSGSTFGVVQARGLKTRTNVKFGQTSTGVTFVQPYTKPFHIAKRAFMQPAFQAVEPVVNDAITKAIARAIAADDASKVYG